MKFSVIITAGGIGKRMGAGIPKQFIALNGKPILVYTIQRFLEALPDAQMILTLPEDYLTDGREMLQSYSISNVEVIAGGVERFHSIKNALEICTGELIAVHDGVRPFVSIDTIHQLFDEAKNYKAAIPFLTINDSMRKLEGEKSGIVARSEYVTVQTPQVFDATVLKKGYEQDYSDVFTDDASVVEQLGYTIKLVPGNHENIKITTSFDLKISQLFI